MSSVPPYTPPGGGAAAYPPYDPQDAMARLPRTAESRVARPARRLEGTAACMEGRLRGRLRPARALGRRPHHPGRHRHCWAADRTAAASAAANFWAWYGHWWPLLLIGAGLALLGEWALDLRRETPVRRSGGFVGILILLAILGFARRGMEQLLGSDARQLGRRQRQLLQLLRPARARSRPAGAERADSRQRRGRDSKSARRRERDRGRRQQHRRCRRTRWPSPAPTTRPRRSSTPKPRT